MKVKPEIIFGGIAALAGVYVAWKQTNAPAPVVNVSQLPPLQMPSQSAASSPTIDTAAAPTYNFTTNDYSDPDSLAPITMQALQAPPVTSSQQTPAYQSYNLPPTHDARKAQQQAVQQQKQQQQVAQQGACGCNSPCNPAPVNAQGVPSGTSSYGAYNLSTIALPQQPTYNSPDILDSTISQYYTGAAVVPIINSYAGQGTTPIANVPNGVHDNHLAGYGL